jgi:hypothetical protein
MFSILATQPCWLQISAIDGLDVTFFTTQRNLTTGYYLILSYGDGTAPVVVDASTAYPYTYVEGIYSPTLSLYNGDNDLLYTDTQMVICQDLGYVHDVPSTIEALEPDEAYLETCQEGKPTVRYKRLLFRKNGKKERYVWNVQVDDFLQNLQQLTWFIDSLEALSASAQYDMFSGTTNVYPLYRVSGCISSNLQSTLERGR